MIQMDTVKSEEYSKVKLPIREGKFLIEVASNKKLDVALVTSAQLGTFEESDDPADAEINWFEEVYNYDFIHESTAEKERKYLLYWNSNEPGAAVVAYRISPIG